MIELVVQQKLIMWTHLLLVLNLQPAAHITQVGDDCYQQLIDCQSE